MNTDKIALPEGARQLTPLEMNGIAILKAHTVITFPSTAKSRNDHTDSGEETESV